MSGVSVPGFLVSIAIDAIKSYMKQHPRCEALYDMNGKPKMSVTYRNERETRNRRVIGGGSCHPGMEVGPPEFICDVRERKVTILHADMKCGNNYEGREIGPIDWDDWGPWREDYC